MSKKMIPRILITDYRSGSAKPYKWGEIIMMLAREAITLESDDELEIGYSEAVHDEDRDSRYVCLTRYTIETDEEYNKRLEEEAFTKAYRKKQRHETYLNLKKEFEGE